jgi:hypothetical protein
LLLSQPTVWVSDAAAIRRLLAAEHRLVITQWPTAMQTLLGTSFQGALRSTSFQGHAHVSWVACKKKKKHTGAHPNKALPVCP